MHVISVLQGNKKCVQDSISCALFSLALSCLPTSIVVAQELIPQEPKFAGTTKTGFLLPNGWCLTSAGEHIETTDLLLNIQPLSNSKTDGTRPGAFTPEACVGRNDQAIGKLVEAVSHGPLWKETAIFIVENDAQKGPDHVDAHRTLSLVISLYIRNGKILDTIVPFVPDTLRSGTSDFEYLTAR